MSFKVGDKALFVGADNPLFVCANGTVVTVEAIGPFKEYEHSSLNPEYAISGNAIPNLFINHGLCFTWERNLIPLLPPSEYKADSEEESLEICKS